MRVNNIPKNVSAGVNELWVIQVNSFGQLLDYFDCHVSHQFDFGATILWCNFKNSLFTFFDFIFRKFAVDAHSLALLRLLSRWWRGLLLLLFLFFHYRWSFLFHFFLFRFFRLSWWSNYGRLFNLLLLGRCFFWVLLVIIFIVFRRCCNLNKLQVLGTHFLFQLLCKGPWNFIQIDFDLGGSRRFLTLSISCLIGLNLGIVSRLLNRISINIQTSISGLLISLFAFFSLDDLITIGKCWLFPLFYLWSFAFLGGFCLWCLL